MSSEESSVDLSGRVFGNWRLERRLGEGGFGAVYEAMNVGIAGRRAAVKVLHPHMAFNAEIKRRFINEASAASRAEHENIVQVFDGGVTPDGFCYCVMELLRGSPLTKLIQAGQFETLRATNIGAQVASALRAAHELGIVHRDLKPDNIYVVARETNAEFVKVLDFGVAKLMSPDGGTQTQAGMLIGTPAYMSPEQWQALPDIDGRSDIYALGVILFEMVTGGLPFGGNSTYEWLDAHINREPPDPAQWSKIDPRLSRLILKMLRKKREERPQSMGEVVEALKAIRGPSGAFAVPQLTPEQATMLASGDGELSQSGKFRAVPAAGGTPAPQPRAPTPAPVVPSTVTPGPVSRSSTPSPPAKRGIPPALIAIAAVLVLGGGGVGIWAATRTRPEPKPPEPERPPPVETKAKSDDSAKDDAKDDGKGDDEDDTPPPTPPGLVAIPGGTLQMGRPAGKIPTLDAPVHPVKVAPFAIGKSEVTVGDYREYVEAEKARAPWSDPREPERRPKQPVVNVTREEAEAYCHWRYPKGGRLPTEAEWEWAARGREANLYPYGPLYKKECTHGPRPTKKPVDVDALPACGATVDGVIGMSGNVWEWTSSPAASYPGSALPAPPPGFFVVRGGSAFNQSPDEVTATTRSFVNAPNALLGFRCAATL
jgi:serine/threonine-protein kinase